MVVIVAEVKNLDRLLCREKTDFKHLLCSYEFWEKTAKENTTLQLPVFSLTEGKDRGKRPEGT